jgi:hypothetical protein
MKGKERKRDEMKYTHELLIVLWNAFASLERAKNNKSFDGHRYLGFQNVIKHHHFITQSFAHVIICVGSKDSAMRTKKKKTTTIVFGQIHMKKYGRKKKQSREIPREETNTDAHFKQLEQKKQKQK